MAREEPQPGGEGGGGALRGKTLISAALRQWKTFRNHRLVSKILSGILFRDFFSPGCQIEEFPPWRSKREPKRRRHEKRAVAKWLIKTHLILMA